jgi:hypothetical protein
MAKNLIQAYQQAPWRVQIQRIGFVALLLVASAVIAGLYLSISANSAEAGVAIKRQEATREAVHYQIESLKTELSDLGSARVMQEKAIQLGFERYSPEDVEYMEVPGYLGRQTAQLAPAFGGSAPVSVIKPAYTQSLWEWLLDKMLQMGNQ